MRCWKSYICSNKLDVQEANFSFAQFNRIRNHLFGRWIEIVRDSRSRFVGSDFCLSLEIQFRHLIDRGNPLFAVTQVTRQSTTTDSLKARTQQAIQNGTLIQLGLVKSGNLMN